MPLVGYDSAEITTGHAHEIAAHEEGFKAAGLYGRPDRCTKEMVDGIRSVGIGVWALYEKGLAENLEYYTVQQGKQNGLLAGAFWKAMGLPVGKQVFDAIDLDVGQRDLENVIQPFHTAFREGVMSFGYLASVYGSGLVCAWLKAKGLGHEGWLAFPARWNGNAMFRGDAAILQGEEFVMELPSGASFKCDRNTVMKPEILW